MTPTPAPPAWAHRTTDATVEQLAAVDAWWRAANYLSIGQIYLQGNPLLRHRLSRDDIKPRLLLAILGHLSATARQQHRECQRHHQDTFHFWPPINC